MTQILSQEMGVAVDAILKQDGLVSEYQACAHLFVVMEFK